MIKDFDEIKIIQDLKLNKENALEKCINFYFRYVAVIVDNITGSILKNEDKEEIVSSVFISLWNHRQSLDVEKYYTLKNYLAAIARNTSKNYLKKANTNSCPINIDDIICISTSDDIQKKSIKNEILKTLRECINELPHDERICILFYHYYGKSISQIQNETGFKENTIKSKLFRGRIKLKEKLTERGFGYEECKVFFG